MFDYELHKKVKEIEQQLKKKYQLDSLKIFITSTNDKLINFDFKHFEITGHDEIIEKIMNDTIALLKKHSYKYELGVKPPSPVSISDYKLPIPNETTIDGYSLIKVEEN